MTHIKRFNEMASRTTAGNHLDPHNDDYLIYIISDTNEIMEKYSSIDEMPDAEFMDIAEEEGTVYTLHGFQEDWNKSRDIPYSDNSYIRILPESVFGVLESKKAEPMNEMNKFKLDAQYDSRASFYGKADVVVDDNGNYTLFSYDTKIATIENPNTDNELLVIYGSENGYMSQTTKRHLTEFTKQFTQHLWVDDKWNLARTLKNGVANGYVKYAL